MLLSSVQPSACRPCRNAAPRAWPSGSSSALFISTAIRRTRPDCCACATSGDDRVAAPSSVMKSRRLTPCIGLPPLGWATDTYRILNLAQSGGQVLGANLNCSESERPLILKGLAPDSLHG